MSSWRTGGARTQHRHVHFVLFSTQNANLIQCALIPSPVGLLPRSTGELTSTTLDLCSEEENVRLTFLGRREVISRFWGNLCQNFSRLLAGSISRQCIGKDIFIKSQSIATKLDTSHPLPPFDPSVIRNSDFGCLVSFASRFRFA